MTINLEGRTMAVTGSANGIGKAVAFTLAGCGARVAVVDLDGEKAGATAQEILGAGGTALAVAADVTSEKSVAGMVERINGELGPIDALVCSAAVLIPPRPFHTIDLKDWEMIYSVDVKGLFLCCKAVAPQMIDRKKGVIVNMGSVAGKIPRLNMAAYCSAKAAVIHLTKVIALELAPHNIRVMAHCPGTTSTDMVLKTITGGKPEELGKWLAGIPLGKLATPQDQANFVAFLVSDYASHMTGQAVNVDGGQVMW